MDMNESTKCFDMRLARGDFDRWLHGNGIDIGCGPDPLKLPPGVSGSVLGWDRPQGDGASLPNIEDRTFDFIYSSHCLEHLNDVGAALARWTEVLKPGGFLYIVVPDFELYEHGRYPIAGPHKHSFSLTLDKAEVAQPNHWHVHKEVVPRMDQLGCRLVTASLEDDGFDYSLKDSCVDQTLGNALAQILMVFHYNKVKRQRVKRDR